MEVKHKVKQNINYTMFGSILCWVYTWNNVFNI